MMDAPPQIAFRTLKILSVLILSGPLLLGLLALVRPRSGRESKLWVRFGTLIGLTAGYLFIAWLGPWPFAVLVTGGVALGVQELRRTLAAAGLRAPAAALACAAAAPLGAALMGHAAVGPAVTAAAILGSLVALTAPSQERLAWLGGAAAAIVYVGLPASFLVALRSGPGGFGAVLLLYVVMQFNDIASLLGGLAFGRRQMAPELSPRKTWGGFIAGMVAALGAALLFSYALPQLSRAALLGLAALLALAGVAGGLLASAVKRACGVKDFGTALPGHGGVLDRFDSTLLAAPVAWAAMQLLTLGR